MVKIKDAPIKDYESTEKILIETRSAPIDISGKTPKQVYEYLEEHMTLEVAAGGVYDTYTVEYEYFGYDGAFDIVLKGKRIETDQEFEARQTHLKAMRSKQKKKEDKEYEQYLRLKKKFEKKA